MTRERQKENKIDNEQKEDRLNEALREDLSRLERYFEEYSLFLPLAVLSVNPIGIIIDANRAGEQITGYDSLEITGKKIVELFKSKEVADKIFKELLDKEELEEKEMILITKERKDIPVRVSTSVIKDEAGNVISSFWAISDISDFKQLQKKLEEKAERRTESLEESRKALMNVLEDTKEAQKKAENEKERTQAIINSLSDGLIVLDYNNKITTLNPEAERVLKVNSSDIEGYTLEGAYKQGKVERLYEALEGEIRWTGKVYEVVFEKPTKRYFEVKVTPMTIGGERSGTIIVLHDVTREKEMQKMKTEFVSVAAHQLRTPLSAIKWSLNMLLEGDTGEFNSQQKEFLEKTYRSNERMIHLINDLLNVTRIEEGRYVYERERVNMVELAEAVMEDREDEIQKKNIDFVFNKPSLKNIPEISVDKEKIKIVLENLLDNAIKYTPENEKVEFTIEHNKKKEEIKVTVRDNGVGIPKKEQNEIFSKFSRGENVKRMDTEGSGLGLFITKNIVEAHDGAIWFESEEGEGTTFYFSLPVRAE